MLRLSAAIVLSIVLLSGCATPHPESILDLSHYSIASVTNKDGDTRSKTKDISVEALTPLLIRAKWVDRRLVSMGNLCIIYPSGQKIFLAIGFDYFRVEGIRGHFDIRPEDIGAYRQAIDGIRQNANRAPE